MSLIIATVTPFGIVASADTRTTTKIGKEIQYSDETQKVYPYGKNAVILTCGDNKIGEKMLVHDFITEFMKNYDFSEIKEIAFQLLCDALRVDKNANVIFIVAGYNGYDAERVSCAYRVNTATLEVTMCLDEDECGALHNGITNISHAMLDDCDYNNINIKGAIELNGCTIKATGISLKYSEIQSVGTVVDTYIIGRDKKNTGWVSYTHSQKNKQAAAVSVESGKEDK